MTLRPAWRSQFGLLTIAIILLVLTFLPLLGSLRSTNGVNSSWTIGSMILALPFIVVCLIMIYRHYSSRFSIADGNIESRHGLVARKVSSVRVEDVRSLNVKQSIFQRILSIGDVEFSSAASAEAEVIFNKVANPIGVKEKVQSLL